MRTRFPPAAWFTIAMSDVAGWHCKRSSSRSGQRSFLLVVEPRPPVSESPSMTAAAADGLAHVSTALRKYQWPVVVDPRISTSSTWFPASKWDVALDPG